MYEQLIEVVLKNVNSDNAGIVLLGTVIVALFKGISKFSSINESIREASTSAHTAVELAREAVTQLKATAEEVANLRLELKDGLHAIGSRVDLLEYKLEDVKSRVNVPR